MRIASRTERDVVAVNNRRGKSRVVYSPVDRRRRDFARCLWRWCGRRIADSRSISVSDVIKEAPSPAQLSREEQEAIDNKNAGRPYDQAAYNRAMQKIKQAEKYNGDRNK
ncbi:hypothetical protein AB0L97_18530 [Nocardia sp. NPDC051911]|uniref:hypothetical protein n=1 Tax=Nocardia sp. NPDC051911 TaxID=3154648 RepID=UPI00341260CE